MKLIPVQTENRVALGLLLLPFLVRSSAIGPTGSEALVRSSAIGGPSLPADPEEFQFYARMMTAVAGANPYLTQGGYVLNGNSAGFKVVMGEMLDVWREAKLASEAGHP